ncbi:hypothetical protein [Fontibacter flavus]|uniref:Outer membrane protein beta-barrel domain-containing protein n=1 Tax=Fontibacter flavus TaxID=654838 RepID=A0ABV6FTZ0_9BACT
MKLTSIKLITTLFFCIALCSGNLVTAQNFQKQATDKTHQVSLGVGPSFIYADNGGDYPSMTFPVRPNFSLAYTKSLVKWMGIRFSTGLQRVGSWDGFNPGTLENWASRNQTASYKGSAMYFDIMPQFLLFPQDHITSRPKFNAYGGIGFGALYINRNQNPDSENSNRVSTVTSYLPIRAGVTYVIGDLFNIGLEATFFKTFADDLDGNIGHNNRNDHMGQFNVVLHRYF